MPPKRKRRGRQKRLHDEQDDTESESGKLSETQEVARRLSRARLGKENSSKVLNTPVLTQRESEDSYDADSEPDGNNQPMLTDQHLRSQSQEDHDRVPSFHSDHSTPCVQVAGGWSPLPFSPVGAPQPPLPFDTSQRSISASSSVVSPRKRKPDIGFFDIPFTKPRKTKKRKAAVAQKTELDELEEMRIHFMEIEKQELFVE